MENLTSVQQWQVDVGGQIYEARFNELGEWINEGSLHPEDKVRKGNLRWIEAGKVPGLIPFFNAKAKGEPMPLVITAATSDEQNPDSAPKLLPNAVREVETTVADSTSQYVVRQVTPEDSRPVDPTRCSIHPDIESFYVCGVCENGFCKPCPRSYGGSVKICPTCGAMCKTVVETQKDRQMKTLRSNAIVEGFGIADFFSAIAYPFRFKSSLLFGATLFAFFSLGQSATGIGGILMFAAALVCVMLANMLTFGVLANTVEKFAHGNIEANFMPDFDDFSLWDDVVHPFFLSIAAYLVSFGPFFLTAIIGIYLVVSAVSSQMNTFQSEMEKLPGTQYYAGRETVEQSQQVKSVLNDISEEQEDLFEEHNEAAKGNTTIAPTKNVDEDLELWNQLQESRKRELEAAFGKTTETREKEFQGVITSILSLAAPLVVFGAITFLWGVFFYPAACAVAGYTRSFVATINPLVGLDTIRRLGVSYLKILIMGVALVFVSVFVGSIFTIIFLPFDLPGMGNIPAKILSSFVTFYLFAVFSCILGYALFKNAHKLDLAR